jgi:hypothetical protein
VDDVAGGGGLAGADFSDRKKAEAWLEKQSIEVCCALASRAALRVCANLCIEDEPNFPLLALPYFRAMLTSTVRGLGRTSDADWLRSASVLAHTAADPPSSPLSTHPAAYSGDSISSAAYVAAADNSTDSASAAASALFSSASAASAADLVASGQSGHAAAFGSGHPAAKWAAFKDSTRTDITDYLIKLWHDIEVPRGIAENHDTFLAILKSDATKWVFWHDWYLGMWEGRFTDWDLAIDVAKIPDDVWEEGAKAVAKAIHEIEARQETDLPRPDNVPELDRSKLLNYVQKLLANPDMTALAAEGAAQTLRQAIATYLRDAPANTLPDALAHLEGLPTLLDGIATLAKSGGRSEAKVRQMADLIEALNAKVAQLEAQLKEARTKTVNGLFTQNMLRAAGTAFGAGAVATLGLSVRHFFGEWPDEFTLENLRGFLIDLETATPIESTNSSLPPATDV